MRALEVDYEYVWEGQTLRGHRVSPFNYRETDKSSLERIAAQLHVGEKLPCYVNPDNPNQAYLFRQINWEHVLIHGLISGACIAVGSVFVRSSFRRKVAKTDLR